MSVRRRVGTRARWVVGLITAAAVTLPASASAGGTGPGIGDFTQWVEQCHGWYGATLSPGCTDVSVPGVLTSHGTVPYAVRSYATPADGNAVLTGALTVRALGWDSAVIVGVDMLDAAGSVLGGVRRYVHPYPYFGGFYTYPSSPTVAWQEVRAWGTPGTYGFTVDLAQAFRSGALPGMTATDIGRISRINVWVTGYSDVGAAADFSLSGLSLSDRTPASADTTPPVSRASVTPAPNAAGWSNRDTTVDVTATDEAGGSGVRSIVYRQSGAQTTAATVAGSKAAIPVTDEGVTTITYHAVDNAGNVEADHSLAVRLDKTPPTVTWSGNRGTYTVDQQVAITCTASDAVSGVDPITNTCRNVTGPAYAFPIGTSTYTAQAADRAGNLGRGSSQFTVRVTYDSLAALTTRFSSKAGVAKALNAKLEAAKAAAARGNRNARAGALSAYRHQVAAQSGKALTRAQAATLTRLAQAL